MVLETLTNAFVGFFNTIINLIYIIYTLVLVAIFFALQAVTIWVYFRLGVYIKTIVLLVKDWLTINTERFTEWLEYETQRK